jgi:hypothetical protein
MLDFLQYLERTMGGLVDEDAEPEHELAGETESEEPDNEPYEYCGTI